MPDLAIAVCCREWIVDPRSRIGHCGLCGETPVIDWMLEVPDPTWPQYSGDEDE